MRHLRTFLAAAVLATATSTPVPASTVVVPTQYATLQSAIASGADTVYVRDGTYPENVTVDRDLVLMRHPAVNFGDQQYARFDRLKYQGMIGMRFVMQGLGVRHGATLAGSGDVRFEACRFDSGLTCSGAYLYATLSGCQFLERLSGTFYNLRVTTSTFWHTGINVGFEGILTLRYNLVQGPVATGIEVWDGDSGVQIEGNTVVGAGTGILVYIPIGGYVRDNQLLDIAGDGIRVDNLGRGASALLTGNEIRRCGGNGIRIIGGDFDVVSNTIDSVGQCGVSADFASYANSPTVVANTITHAGAEGVRVAPWARAVRSNRVIAANGSGIQVASADTVELNVVGRCAGAGVAAAAPETRTLRLMRNTAYLNTGPGFSVTTTGPAEVRANIAHANLGHGAAWVAGGAPALSCNDWSANVAGTASPGPVGGTDVSVDPWFCRLSQDDVTLAASSPLLALAGTCGSIGALGVGCASPLEAPVGPAEGPSLRAYPNPARGGVRFTFRPEAAVGRLDVYDITGARRWSMEVPAGAAHAEWDGIADGEGPPTGVYFARMTRAGHVVETRVAIMR